MRTRRETTASGLSSWRSLRRDRSGRAERHVPRWRADLGGRSGRRRHRRPRALSAARRIQQSGGDAPERLPHAPRFPAHTFQAGGRRDGNRRRRPAFGQPGTAAAPSLRDLTPARPLATASGNPGADRVGRVRHHRRGACLPAPDRRGDRRADAARGTPPRRRCDGPADAESNGRAQSH